MRPRDYLGHFEVMVLLAILRVGEDAYGVPIGREIERCTGRGVSLASVYAALQRLESKKLVRSAVGESSAERGGRAKTYFQVTSEGMRRVRATQRSLNALWRGLPQLEAQKL